MGGPRRRVSNTNKADKDLWRKELMEARKQYPYHEDTAIRKDINQRMLAMLAAQKGRIEIITELTNLYPDRATYIVQMFNQRAPKYSHLQQDVTPPVSNGINRFDDGEER